MEERAAGHFTKSVIILASAVCEQQSADQPARSRSLFSAFAIRFLQSMISELAIDSTSLANLCSLAGWSQIDLLGNLEDRFRHVDAHLYI